MINIRDIREILAQRKRSHKNKAPSTVCLSKGCHISSLTEKPRPKRGRIFKIGNSNNAFAFRVARALSREESRRYNIQKKSYRNCDA